MRDKLGVFRSAHKVGASIMNHLRRLPAAATPGNAIGTVNWMDGDSSCCRFTIAVADGSELEVTVTQTRPATHQQTEHTLRLPPSPRAGPGRPRTTYAPTDRVIDRMERWAHEAAASPAMNRRGTVRARLAREANKGQ